MDKEIKSINSTKNTEQTNRQLKYDDIKDVIRRGEGILEILILTAMYYATWVFLYRDISKHHFLYNGKYVFCLVYIFLTGVIFALCDSFKFGHLKLSDVAVSQGISITFVNLIAYLQACLISNGMINPLGLIALTVVDYFVCFGCSWFFTWIYHKNNVPKDLIMIYGTDNAISMKFKMDTRPDKYFITKMVKADADLEEILAEIPNHDAVLINDVPSNVRNRIVKFCYFREIRTYVVPKISDIINRGADEINLFDTPLLLIKGRGLSKTQRMMKRGMDLLLSFIALIICSPIMLIIAIAIKIEDGGPVFYKQRRITRGGRQFDILKFRSMIVDAEKGGYDLSMRANGKDPRITKVGNAIRGCRLDELPQILNILKGDMSIVGPRPERVENVMEYSDEIPEFLYRNKVRGGLTGYAQIYGKYNTSAYDKIRMDLMYIENYSIFLDIKLIFMTLQILVKPESTEGFDAVEKMEEMKKEILSKEE